MGEYIPLLVPSLKGKELQYVKECLETEWVSSAGKYVDEFEQKIAEYTGARRAVSCINGTSALQVSLRIAGVEKGDEVIVPTLTFIAPINAVSYNGAIPVFMDCDRHYNMDAEKTINFIHNETQSKITDEGSQKTVNKRTGNRIAAIMPVHIWGNAASLDELIPICEERNINVVEDASESMGTFYSKNICSGKHTGTISSLGCLSFNGNKIITAGGGGMIITNDEKLAEKARYLTTQAKDDPLRYVHHEIGYNFRLNNIQAALGIAQLEQLPEFLRKKQNIKKQYLEAMENIDGLDIAPVPSYADNNNWMNLLQINIDIYGMDRDLIMAKLEHNGIQTRPVWALNHLQRPYKKFQSYKIEKADNLVKKSLCLPSSTNLSDEDIQEVISKLN